MLMSQVFKLVIQNISVKLKAICESVLGHTLPCHKAVSNQRKNIFIPEKQFLHWPERPFSNEEANTPQETFQKQNLFILDEINIKKRRFCCNDRHCIWR